MSGYVRSPLHISHSCLLGRCLKQDLRCHFILMSGKSPTKLEVTSRHDHICLLGRCLKQYLRCHLISMSGKNPTKLEVTSRHDHICLLGRKASNQTNKRLFAVHKKSALVANYQLRALRERLHTHKIFTKRQYYRSVFTLITISSP